MGQGEGAAGDGAEAGARLGRSIRIYKSSRMPRKNGCRTFPSGDFARCSISASSFGSTHIPLYATRFANGCVFRTSGVSRFRKSAAETLSKPWSTLSA